MRFHSFAASLLAATSFGFCADFYIFFFHHKMFWVLQKRREKKNCLNICETRTRMLASLSLVFICSLSFERAHTHTHRCIHCLVCSELAVFSSSLEQQKGKATVISKTLSKYRLYVCFLLANWVHHLPFTHSHKTTLVFTQFPYKIE